MTDYHQTATRLLDAHGFIHEAGDMWLNAGLTQWATAGVDCEKANEQERIWRERN
ncbi:MAG: hypothetical protein QM703_13600 [Gemmatales bacterium]